MKILFALDPWIYRDTVGDQLYTLENIFVDSIKSLFDYGHEVRLILGEDMAEAINQKNINLACEVFTIPLQELYKIHDSHYQAHQAQYDDTETAEQSKAFKKLVVEQLGEWEPEVIISFTTPVSVWKKCYPEALSMQFENGIFSRTPYPYLCQLDPFGFLAKSYAAVFSKELRDSDISPEQSSRISKLKIEYEHNIFDKFNPFSREGLVDYKEQKVVLVPLSYNGVIINDAASKYKSQLDFLLDVMYRVPKDTIVLFTKHSLQMKGEIPAKTEEYLMKKFPNLRYDEKFDRYAFASQWLTPLVDGIISINSTVAYHGAFWSKKVFTVGECEINSVATAENLDKIEGYLAEPDKQDKKANNVLYHLLSRYCFRLEDFWDAKWLADRLEKLIASQKIGKLETDFTGMPLLGDEDKIFDSLLKDSPAMKEGYQPRLR